MTTCLCQFEIPYLSQGSSEPILSGLLSFQDTSVQLAMGEDKPIVDDDPWALPELQPTGKPWADMTTSERVQRVVINIVKIITLLSLLYLFICSLDFLSQAFRLVGGRTASQVFSSSELLTNPVVGLMMGCLVTVLVQSSSTSTSIIVSMVASGLLQVRTCIPMIMGANIGTSITNTIVSLTQVADRNEFRRAFGGATVHDMFNWLAVLSLLPLELIIQAINPSGQGYLELMTDAILNSVNLDTAKGHKLKLLKVITSPFTSLVIKTDKKVLTGWALNDSRYFDASLVKHYCKYETTTVLGVNNVTETVKVPLERCHSLFSLTDLPDLYVGLILLVIALVLLCGCLVLMVKILHTLLKGKRVDLLLGANVLEAVLQLEARTGKAGQPVAIRTAFGWTLTGTVKGFLPERTRQLRPGTLIGGGELVLSEAAASWCARQLRRAGALRGCGELVLSEAAASWCARRLRRAGALRGCGELVRSSAAASWCSPRLRRAGALRGRGELVFSGAVAETLAGCGELVLSEAAASWCARRLRRAGALRGRGELVFSGAVAEALVGRGELVLSEVAASWCARRLRRAGALRGRGELVFSGAVAETLVGRGELVLSEAAASWWFSGAGSIAVVIRKTLNANIPYMPWLTGYLAILVGCGMTILVQSSSVFTSAMTPLVGVGVISLDRMYPLTLGSNIGTTTTAILAALAASGDTLRPSIQIALVHFFFNISGILLFYVLPFMRWPIPLARGLGNITADYRWFAVAYLLGMFLLLPLVVFGLSLAGAVVLYVVLALVAVLALAVGLLNLLQRRAPRLLPDALRTWEFLPEPLRSLAPYDRLVSALTARCRCCRSAQADDSAPEKSADATLQFNGKPTGNGFDNPALEMDVQPVSYSSRSVD
ncbi:Sodium-dependent phosphate transport protein 2B [Amphibalanus amphitrite]|uniref:Sodium-dependent phosphate transport protein 2B n=1 Tax=Amphibalanus amphitrite TaxID=1232801 RepID=A0A6A4WIJ7_AMPAM|nr:Sodium-dependent phosphate transport protein 2B [Amphibalanus amphitrite]